MKEVHLSASVMSFDPEGAKNLERITVSSKNDGLYARDDMLYRYNIDSGETYCLEYFPRKKKFDTYTVPEGIGWIGAIKSDTLKTIKLPNSLEYIETIIAKKLMKLTIPPNVRSIDKINIPGKITLAKGNKYFSMSKGVIFDKNLKTLKFNARLDNFYFSSNSITKICIPKKSKKYIVSILIQRYRICRT